MRKNVSYYCISVLTTLCICHTMTRAQLDFEIAKSALSHFDTRHINHECIYEAPRKNDGTKIVETVNKRLQGLRVTRYSLYWNIAVWLLRTAAQGKYYGGDVLEISGTSLLRQFMTKKGTRFTRADYPAVDITKLDEKYEPGTFDGVIMDQVLEHVANPFLAVVQAWRVLKKGGFLMIVVPSTYPYHWGPWDFWRYSPDALKSLVSPFSGIELCGCYRSNTFIQWLAKVYPTINIYPATSDHAFAMAQEPPAQRSATKADYGRGIGSAERNSTGDPKYGEFMVSSWIIARK